MRVLNKKYQIKVTAIGSWLKSVDCFDVYIYIYPILPKNPVIDTKSYFQIPIYLPLYCIYDNGIVRRILSHLKALKIHRKHLIMIII